MALDAEERLRRQLQKWREDLVDLTRRNRALSFKATSRGTTLVILAPTPDTIVSRLDEGGEWRFHYPPLTESESEDDALKEALKAEDTELTDDLAPDELLTDVATSRDLSRIVRSISARTSQEFLDKGLRILYLALGAISWKDDGGQDWRSPVYLVPVSLARTNPRSPFLLAATDDDSFINPALVLALNEYGIDLSDIGEAASAREALTEAQARIATTPRFTYEEAVAIATFSFQKEVMYRDLGDNEAAIVGHPIIRALALGPSDAEDVHFDPVPEERLDEIFPPETLASILDADATQRVCIAAAREGKSFVMDGPPGSGKSQTIANIIAELIAVGRSVLFVSEKIAALEVVKQRLDRAELGHYVLEIHSHKATRKQIAQELGKALVERPAPGRTLSATKMAQAARARSALSAYAAAMNDVRQPLGRSLHEVLGRIATLDDAGVLEEPDGIDASLSSETLLEILDVATRLADAWGPVSRAGDFLWRDLADPVEALRKQGDLERLLQQLRSDFVDLTDLAEAVATELGVAVPTDLSEARTLDTICAHLTRRPDVPQHWLTVDDFTGVSGRIGELESLHRGLEQSVTELESRSPGWRDIDPTRLAGFADSILPRFLIEEPTGISLASTVGDVRTLLRTVNSAVDDAQRIRKETTELQASLGIPEEPVTPEDLSRFAALALLARSATPAETPWLDRDGLRTARTAFDALRVIIDELRRDQGMLDGIFTSELRHFDIETLYEGEGSPTPSLGRFSKEGRKNRKALAALTPDGKITDAVVAALPVARSSQRTRRRLVDAEATHGAVLGAHYYRSEETDLDTLEAALGIAEEALQLAGRNADAAALGNAVGRGSIDGAVLARDAESLVQRLTRLIDSITTATALTAARLDGMTLDAITTWLSELARALDETDAQCSVATARDSWTIAETIAFTENTVLAHQSEAEINRRLAEDADLLGPAYLGSDTEWSELQSACDWCTELRRLLGGPIDSVTAGRIQAWEPTALPFGEAISHATDGLDRFTTSFSPARMAELTRDFTLSFANALDMIDAFSTCSDEIAEWGAFTECCERLRSLGIARTLDHGIALSVESGRLADAIERAVLAAWAEEIIARHSGELGHPRAAERDQLVNDFRASDVALVEHAAARVREAANARRPSSVMGTGGIIKREAEKKARHMPIRRLLAEAGGTAQACKPCFMMSPLSVSSFLPPTMRFDTVIFDEASQVRPSDAINAIYRADQVIIAGDERQLPPTSFFDRLNQSDSDEYDEDDLDDFESVLKIAQAGALPPIPLRWHYRSRHESLITYSNYSFYDGRLITFPGAIEEAPDLGVEFVHVPDGVYSRSGARDNPVEARRVVERVIHHATANPGDTLGVVAFSDAQAGRIAYELEAERRKRPDLDKYFAENRLDGFFVKNLENVQGDERDIIIFSVGYAKDEFGKFTLNFGPVNKAGGWRRLNVAFTRARKRVEVVSSILPSDIGDSTSDGVRHLRRYLDYALRGMAALAIPVDPTTGDAESPFEEEVLRVVRAWGFDAVPQVGTAGFRIDIGVRHPERPGAYALGIECDGAMYHSSRVARDRDRLRQQVLEGLGWRLHRIWGTSWYRNRAAAEADLKQAIEDAIAGRTRNAVPKPKEESAPVEVTEVDFSDSPPWALPYAKSTVKARKGTGLSDVTAGPEIERVVTEVVRAEGPVSVDLCMQRVRDAFGMKYLSAQGRDRVDRYIRQLVNRGALDGSEEGFLSAPGSSVSVRVPDDPETKRSIRDVSWAELHEAIRRTVADAHRITDDQLITAIARLFGWARTEEVRNEIRIGIDDLVGQAKLVRAGATIAPRESDLADPPDT